MFYKGVGDKLSTLKVRNLILGIVTVSLLFIGYPYIRKTEQGIEPYIKNQWHNLYLLTGPFESWNVPLILFDIEVLPHVVKPRREIWHDPAYTCRILCKRHHDGNNLITFAVLARKFIPEKDNIMTRLEKVGFAVHLSEVPDPRLHDAKEVPKIPTYIWLAKNDHVIHITILHDRHGEYYWAGPVTDSDWIKTVNILKPQMSQSWESLNRAVFPRHAQAYEKSHHLTGVSTKIDSHELIVPYNIGGFLKEYSQARFIECNHNSAEIFRKTYPIDVTQSEHIFQSDAKKVLARTKKILEQLKVPFWLSSGTLLGWYRQCSIIPHSVDVDIGVWIHDYRVDIIEAMEKNGLMLKNIFGKVGDSYEMSFVNENDVKLDIFFFYEDAEYVWNGGTRAHDGAKFKYVFPPFTLCWSEFLEMKVRVPCETRDYIEANYGKDWGKPVKNWIWYSSPPNVLPNGYWNRKDWEEVIQIYEREDGTKDERAPS